MTDPQPEHVAHYKPAGPTLKAFHESSAFARFLMGPVGSGKTTACILEILRKAKGQAPGPDGKRHTRWAIIRNSYPELKTTTIKSFHDWCPPQYAKYTETPPITHRLITDELDAEFIFLALDRPEDVKKLLSLELTGAFINEAREVPKAVLDTLTGRVGRYPAVRDGGCSWRGILCDTNPPTDRHWWYKMAEGGDGYEDGPPKGWEFFRQPGGLSPGAENLDNLDPGYYDRLVAGKDPDWVKVYVHGEYGFLREGKPVFTSFRDGVHVSPTVVEPVRGLPLIIASDFGLTPAALIAQRMADGRWLVLDELVADDVGVERFAELLAATVARKYPTFSVARPCWGDPSGAYRDQNAKTAFAIMREYTGWQWRAAPCGNNDLTLRLEVVRLGLNRMVDGHPGLLISPSCGVLREAMNGRYYYRQVQVGEGEQYRDEPQKTHPHSDIADALQYLLLGGGEAHVLARRAERLNNPDSRPKFAHADWNELDGPPGTRPEPPAPGPRHLRKRQRQRFAL